MGQNSDRIARVEEGDSNQTQARRHFRSTHHSDQTRTLLDRDEAAFVHQSLSTPCLNAVRGCDGPWLIDAEGRRILDLHGNGVHVLGFAHRQVVEAVSEQLQTLPFSTRRYTNEPAIQAAERIAQIVSDVEPFRVLLTPAGSLAVGTALKAARLITGRYKAVGMWGSFHGASLDAISIGGERMFRDRMGPLLPGTLHVHPWVPGRSVDEALDELGRLFRVEGDIGALIAEPIRWSTVGVPPAEYWQGVRRLCSDHGAWLIFDEIGTCMGRTGKWCAFQHFDVMPDAVVMGKALGGGVMPLAAAAIRAGLATPAQTQDIALGHFTHEKNPLAAAACVKAIQIISDGLLDRGRTFGAAVLSRMRETFTAIPSVAGVRGIGMIFAIELVDDGTAERVMYRCLRAGLSFKVSTGRVLTLVFPLTISDADVDFALATIRAALMAERRIDHVGREPIRSRGPATDVP
jgi:4-aminobutyrate aminotransferase